MNTTLIRNATQTLIDHVDELTALDSAIGDGDHGLNMRRGALAIQAKLELLATQSLNDALKTMGMTCMSTIGGSSGPVFGTLMVTLSKELPEQPGPADIGRAVAAGITALTRLGKAEVGQKTLLDVLDPVQKVLMSAGEGPGTPGASGIIARVRQCAFDSADATAKMDAIKGRASFLGDRALGHVDPGSRSMALIIGAICDSLLDPKNPAQTLQA
jgi:phosphoenolpyruvate---glycerone phosphotransferase subunit DhaL